MLDLREQTFGGTFLFAPRYLDRDGLSLHYVDEGAGAPVLFVGVAFFDFFHYQTGVAPNEIELHPLLAFRCLA